MENFNIFCEGIHKRVGEKSQIQLVPHWVMMEIRQQLFEGCYEEITRRMLTDFYDASYIDVDPVKLERRVVKIVNMLETPEKYPCLYKRARVYYMCQENRYLSQLIDGAICGKCGCGHYTPFGLSRTQECEKCAAKGQHHIMSLLHIRMLVMPLNIEMYEKTPEDDMYLDRYP